MKRSACSITLRCKDVERVLGVSRVTAGRILYRVRQHYAKTKYEGITLEELCSYEGLAVASAEAALCLR